MDFLVDFEINVPEGTPETGVTARQDAESAAAAKLVDQGHLVRLWKRRVAPGESRPIALYRAESERELVSGHLPEPHLTKVYRLDATLAPPLELGETARGHRRIVPLTGGTFSGPELSGRLLPGASADWQIILPDGTALGDIRYVLQTDRGELLYVQSRGIRHGSPEVLARLGRGDDVDPSEYTFRTATEIETAAPDLDWLNKGIFISVAGRQAAGVSYETYLVG